MSDNKGGGQQSGSGSSQGGGGNPAGSGGKSPSALSPPIVKPTFPGPKEVNKNEGPKRHDLDEFDKLSR